MKIIYLDENEFEWDNLLILREECKKYSIVVGSSVRVGSNVKIGKHTTIGSMVELSSGVRVGENAWIGSGVKVGENATINSNTMIGSNTTIGENATIRSYTDVGSWAVVGQSVRVGLNTTICAGVKIWAGVGVGTGVMISQHVKGIVEKVHHFDSLYRYSSDIITTSKETYIRLGCFTLTVEKWRDNFWNNEAEFPRGSEQGRQRLRAFNTMMFFLGLDELEDTQDEQSQTTKKEMQMKNTIENKAAIYGSYGDQSSTIGKIVEALSELAKANGKKLTEQERVEYTIMALKLTRSVTATGASAIDSWLDLANYSRLSGLRATGIDCIHDLAKIAKTITAIEEESVFLGWRLPTREELKKAYRDKVIGFMHGRYWCSSNENHAWNVNFKNGNVDYHDKSREHFVRCIREANDGSTVWSESSRCRIYYKETLPYCDKLNLKVDD